MVRVIESALVVDVAKKLEGAMPPPPPPRAEKADRDAGRRSGPAGDLAELPVVDSARDGHDELSEAAFEPSRDATAAGNVVMDGRRE